MSRSVECVVAGGGLAGAMSALRLARAGRETLLLEREAGVHAKVCGEFLSPEAVSYLREAGVDPAAWGATAIRDLWVSSGRFSMRTTLPFTALSLSRSALDAALLARAEAAGAKVRRGVAVERVTEAGGRWTVTGSDGVACMAPAVFLATGKHDLRGWQRGPGTQNDLVGFKMHWRLAPEQTAALRGGMELFLFRGGYGGLSLVEGEIANLCFVVRRETLRRVGDWRQVLDGLANQNARVRMYLEGAEQVWERALAISPIPYGYLAAGPDQGSRRGLWRVGDQAAVIPSFTGDGMAIALHSGALAAEVFLKGAAADVYEAKLRGQLLRGMELATALSRVMVTPAGRWLAPMTLRTLPGLTAWIARRTRIPAQALVEEESSDQVLRIPAGGSTTTD